MRVYLRNLRRKLEKVWGAVRNWQCQLDFKTIQIYYRGQGRFHYYINRDEYIRSGVIELNRWHALALVVTITLPIAWFLFGSNPPEAVASVNLQETRQVGGVGNLKTDLRISAEDADLGEKIAEEDERLKDLLLGLEIDKKTGKRTAQRQPVDTKKTVQKIDYKVKPGDTLSKIAKQHNVTVESILGSVKITNPNHLAVGQTLQIPTRVGFYYQVKKNEKLAHILDRHKVGLEKFLEENPDINPDLLNPGDQIFLPGAKPIIPVVSWLIPVASKIITSGYGWRTWPREAFHKGIDLKAAYTTVRSAKAGEVTYAGWLGGYGNVVVVSHDGGYKSLYAHLSRIHVKQGQQVSRGQSLGISGNTGYSFGPHLHFEITKNGENINPAKVIGGLIRRK